MKLNRLLAALATSVLLLAGCGSGPASVAESFYIDVLNGNLDKAAERLDPKLVASLGKHKSLAMLEKMQHDANSPSAVTGVEASEIGEEKNNRQKVAIVFHHKSGPDTRDVAPLVKIDGKWYLGK